MGGGWGRRTPPSTHAPFLCTPFSLPSVHFGAGGNELGDTPAVRQWRLTPSSTLCLEKKVDLHGGEASCLRERRTQESKIRVENVPIWRPRREKKWQEMASGVWGAEEIGEKNVG